MMEDNIAGSSATLSKMAKKVREACVVAMERLKRRRGQQIGGRRQCVVIDESHFRHKRKASTVIIVKVKSLHLVLIIIYSANHTTVITQGFHFIMIYLFIYVSYLVLFLFLKKFCHSMGEGEWMVDGKGGSGCLGCWV